jgi:hypothetical protein
MTTKRQDAWQEQDDLTLADYSFKTFKNPLLTQASILGIILLVANESGENC